jgi:hypothetical protein
MSHRARQSFPHCPCHHSRDALQLLYLRARASSARVTLAPPLRKKVRSSLHALDAVSDAHKHRPITKTQTRPSICLRDPDLHGLAAFQKSPRCWVCVTRLAPDHDVWFQTPSISLSSPCPCSLHDYVMQSYAKTPLQRLENPRLCEKDGRPLTRYGQVRATVRISRLRKAALCTVAPSSCALTGPRCPVPLRLLDELRSARSILRNSTVRALPCPALALSCRARAPVARLTVAI